MRSPVLLRAGSNVCEWSMEYGDVNGERGRAATRLAHERVPIN